MMQVTLIGSEGFVGSAFRRLLEARPDIKMTSVTIDNYAQERGRQSDVVIDASGNSKKFLADEDPLKDFDLSVTHRLHTLIDFPGKVHLHISSVDVYQDLSSQITTMEETAIDHSRQSRYGFHKLLAEELVEKYASEWLIFRLAGMVGPNLQKNPIYDILHNQPLRIHPDSLYQFMHTDQVAQICWTVFEMGLRQIKLNVCAQKLISPRKIACILGRTLDLSLLQKDTIPRIVDVNSDRLAGYLKVPITTDVIHSFLQSFS